MVPEAGFEPARPCDRGILSPLRIPVPPLRRRAAEHTTLLRIGAPEFCIGILPETFQGALTGSTHLVRIRAPVGP